MTAKRAIGQYLLVMLLLPAGMLVGCVEDVADEAVSLSGCNNSCIDDTLTPASSFSASTSGSSIQLSWSNPGDQDFVGVVIRRGTTGYPASAAEGTEVYSGTGASHTDSGMSAGDNYYSVFAQYSVYFAIPAQDQAFHISSGTWATRANMPTGRFALTSSVVNGIVYVIGGSGASDVVEAYDPASNTWSNKANMPTARAYLTSSVVNGIIYVIGGIDANSTGLTAVEAYDPATNSWTSRTSTPSTSSFTASSTVGGIIYVLDTGAYDPSTDTWTSKNLPSGGNISSSAAGGIVYAIGGCCSSTMRAYDPATDSSTILADMPTARHDHTSSVVNGIIHVFGGSNSSGTLNTMEAYDPATDSWSSKASMPTARSILTSSVVNGIIYAIGGISSAGAGIVEAYRP